MPPATPPPDREACEDVLNDAGLLPALADFCRLASVPLSEWHTHPDIARIFAFWAVALYAERLERAQAHRDALHRELGIDAVRADIDGPRSPPWIEASRACGLNPETVRGWRRKWGSGPEREAA